MVISLAVTLHGRKGMVNEKRKPGIFFSKTKKLLHIDLLSTIHRFHLTRNVSNNYLKQLHVKEEFAL